MDNNSDDNDVPSFNFNNKHTGFSLGNLADLNKRPQTPSFAFSWENEFKKIPKNSVKELKILENIDVHTCTGFLKTLEDEEFEIRCSMAKGIKVIGNGDDEDSEVFFSLDGLLMRVSPMYIQSAISGDNDDNDFDGRMY